MSIPLASWSPTGAAGLSGALRIAASRQHGSPVQAVQRLTLGTPRKTRGAVWSVAGDGSSATLTRTNALTQQVTTLATVSLNGIETVRWWNGTDLRGGAVTLYTAAPAAPALSVSA